MNGWFFIGSQNGDTVPAGRPSLDCTIAAPATASLLSGTALSGATGAEQVSGTSVNLHLNFFNFKIIILFLFYFDTFFSH